MTPEERLLNQLMLRQIGTEPEDTPPALEAWENWYAKGQPLPADARRQLWLSPAHRDAYLAARSAHVRQARSILEDQGYFGAVERLAADSDVNHEELVGQGYKLSMTLSDNADWFLLLEIEDHLMEALGPTARWSLVDDGGLIWLEGPCDDGVIERLWPRDIGASPVDRLREFPVRLVPR